MSLDDGHCYRGINAYIHKHARIHKNDVRAHTHAYKYAYIHTHDGVHAHAKRSHKPWSAHALVTSFLIAVNRNSHNPEFVDVYRNRCQRICFFWHATLYYNSTLLEVLIAIR